MDKRLAAKTSGSQRASTVAVGEVGEDRALAHLQAQGLELLARHYRIGGGPHRRAAEIDLILREGDGTVVFVEVRRRADARHGGAAASVSAAKQLRLRRAAAHYLMGWRELPPCRFDVVAIEADQLQWLRAAF